MAQLNAHKKSFNNTPPPAISYPQGELPLLKKVKNAYFLWYGQYQILPKTHRHTLGSRIDTLFITLIEVIAAASFMPRQEKLPYVQTAIRKLDAIKILIMILWETKSLDDKKYVIISEPLHEIGRMLGGWSGQLTKAKQEKQNSLLR